MNLISILVTMTVASIITVAIGRTIVFQHSMAAQIEYLNDTQTARTSIELRADCRRVNLQRCEVSDKNGQLVIAGSIWSVGRADVVALCDTDGVTVFAKRRGTTQQWAPLIPLKVCGGGQKACNLTVNSDTISCEGGSNSYTESL